MPHKWVENSLRPIFEPDSSLECDRVQLNDDAALCFKRFLKTVLSIFNENQSIWATPIHNQKYKLSSEVIITCWRFNRFCTMMIAGGVSKQCLEIPSAILIVQNRLNNQFAHSNFPWKFIFLIMDRYSLYWWIFHRKLTQRFWEISKKTQRSVITWESETR